MLTHYLLTLRDHLHLTDADFADELGLEPQTWQALRDGRVSYSPQILAKLLCHVPNAHALALEEFRHGHDGLSPALTLLDGALAAATSVPTSVAASEPATALAYAA